MTGASLAELVGSRILIIEGGYGKSIEEFQVLEVSPSLTYVRLMNDNGRKIWRLCATVAIVERLSDIVKRGT